MNSSPQTEAPISAEDAAFINAAAQLDAENTPPPVDEQGQPVEPVDYRGEAHMLLQFLVGAAGEFYPSVPKIWTPEKIDAVADRLAPVMEKYGWTLADLGPWKEELALAMIAVPLLLATFAAIRADRAALAAIDKAKASGQGVQKPAAAAPAAPSGGEFGSADLVLV